MRGEPVYLSDAQCELIERVLAMICQRGGWTLLACAAGPERDHVHVILDAPRQSSGTTIRTLLKRWVTQALNERWTPPEAGTWWAEGGSTKVIDNETYLNRAVSYVNAQRATPLVRACEPGGPPPG
jgi:REP element-mobilizing transposase RayT